MITISVDRNISFDESIDRIKALNCLICIFRLFFHYIESVLFFRVDSVCSSIEYQFRMKQKGKEKNAPRDK